jgi:hypothetical protein
MKELQTLNDFVLSQFAYTSAIMASRILDPALAYFPCSVDCIGSYGTRNVIEVIE